MALNYIVVSNHGSVCCMLYHTNVESKGVSKLSHLDQFSEVLPAWQLFPTVTGTPIHDFHKIAILFSEWGMLPALIDNVFGHTTMYDSRYMGVPHVLGRSALCIWIWIWKHEEIGTMPRFQTRDDDGTTISRESWLCKATNTALTISCLVYGESELGTKAGLSVWD